MWIDPLFEADARDAVRHLVASQSLATVVAERPLRATHVPLLLDERDGDLELIGHVPRADAVSSAVVSGERLLCIFHGSRAYVSPAWYETAGLPTYNFSVAHLSGESVPLTSDELRSHLADLIGAEERRKSPATTPWVVDSDAERRIDQLLPAILGFRIRVDNAQVKAKLGQNRTVGDCEGTVEQLGHSEREEHRAVATEMTAELETRTTEGR